MTQRIVLICVLALFPAAQGCLFSGNTKSIQPTVGQELTDLKAAHDKGVITDDEYNQKKLALLKGSSGMPAQPGDPHVANASWSNSDKMPP